METSLFVSTVENDPVSAAIRLRTQCDWSHVGLYRLADGWTFSAMCDGKGVAWRAPIRGARVMLLDAPDADGALKWALTQEGKPYYELNILGLGLGRSWWSADRWICSALVVEAWRNKENPQPLVNMTFIPYEHMTPRDVLLSPFVRKNRIIEL